MSIQYKGPHEVDIPVIDLDDPDDDTLILEQQTNRDARGLLHDLDYDSQPYGFRNPGGFFQKVQAYFQPNRRTSSYELVGNSSDIDSFSIEDDDPVYDDGTRNYHIKRLERKLNKTILAFACGLVLLFAFLFLWRDANPSDCSPISKIILSNSTHNFHPTTLIISLDGFHPHYISKDVTPSLHDMLVNEYGAPYMTPSFPSSTFPNHWTLVTGLYPSEHGIVGNTFFDPVLKKQFINTNPKFGLNPEFWQGGEPIWTTASRQGVTSAIHMWPGSEVPTVGDNGPLFVDRYNDTEALTSKVDRIFGWLDIENLQDRPELILAYVPTIDQVGHKFGISGENLTKALHEVDDMISLTRKRLKERNLENIVNLIVVSDHGMAPTSNDRLLFLDDVVSLDKIEHIDGWPLFGLRPKKEFTNDEIYNEIKSKLDELPDDIKSNFNLFHVEDFPAEWNFGGKQSDHKYNYRLAPIWIVPNIGYSVITHAKFKENNDEYYPRGVHGYNNTELLMRAIFLGSGPYFETNFGHGKKVTPFSNVNVYNLMCDTLGLVPSPNNGTLVRGRLEISPANTLPDGWQDNLAYPNLPFEVDHIVKNATYDLLWREKSFSEKVSEEDTKTNTATKTQLDSWQTQRIASNTITSSAQVSGDTKTENSGGFLGEIVEDFEDAMKDIDSAIEHAVEDAFDFANSLLGHSSGDSED